MKKLRYLFLLAAVVLVLGLGFALPSSQPVSAAGQVKKGFDFGPMTINAPTPVTVPGLTRDNYVDFIITSGTYKFYEKDGWQGAVIGVFELNAQNFTDFFPNPHMKEWLNDEGNALIAGFHLGQGQSGYRRGVFEGLTGVVRYMQPGEASDLCKVEFVAFENGALVSLQPYVISGNLTQTVYAGETVVAPVLKEREGLMFYGWSCTLDTPPFPIIDLATYAITDDCSIIAQWIPASYSLTFDPNGGKRVGGGALEQKNIPMFTACSPPVLEREGFIFLGWRIKGLARIYSNDELVFVTGTYEAAWGAVGSSGIVSVSNNITDEKISLNAEIVKKKYVICIDYFKGTVMKDRGQSLGFFKGLDSMGYRLATTNNLVGAKVNFAMRTDNFDNFLVYMYGYKGVKIGANFFNFQLPDGLVVTSFAFDGNVAIRFYGDIIQIDGKKELVFDYIEFTLEKPALKAVYAGLWELPNADSNKPMAWYTPYIFFSLSGLLLVASVFLILKGHGKEGAMCLLVALAAIAICVVVFL